jgi:hypothetical protein
VSSSDRSDAQLLLLLPVADAHARAVRGSALDVGTDWWIVYGQPQALQCTIVYGALFACKICCLLLVAVAKHTYGWPIASGALPCVDGARSVSAPPRLSDVSGVATPCCARNQRHSDASTPTLLARQPSQPVYLRRDPVFLVDTTCAPQT